MAKVSSKVQSLLDGFSKDIPAGVQNLLVNGQNLSVKQITANLTAYLTLVGAVAPAKVAYRQAVAAVAEQTPQIRAFIAGLAAELRNLFGKGNPVLADFGVASGVRKPSPAKVKAAAAEKGKATRDAKRPKAPAVQVAETPAGSPANGK